MEGSNISTKKEEREIVHYPEGIISVLKELGYVKLLATSKATSCLKELGELCSVEDDIRDALSTAIGISVTGCRVGVFCKDHELEKALDILYSMAITGVRGSLLICVIRTHRRMADPRIITEATWIPLLEPLSLDSVIDYIRAGTELSEVIETPFMISLPYMRFRTIKKAPINGIKVPPIFSKHWEIRYRWIPNEDHYDRVALLLKIYKRLMVKFEFNKVEDIKDKTIIAFGLLYDFARNLLEERGLRSEVSLIGISLYVPRRSMPRAIDLMNIDNCKTIIVLEHGLPFIKSWIEEHTSKEAKIVDSTMLKEKRIAYRTWMSAFWLLARGLDQMERDLEEYIRRVYAISPERSLPLSNGILLVGELISKIAKQLKRKLTLVIGDGEIVEDLIDYIVISKAKPDYSVVTMRYPITIPLDAFDISIAGSNPFKVAEGVLHTNIEAFVVVVARGASLIKYHNDVKKGTIPLIVTVAKDNLRDVQRLLQKVYDVKVVDKKNVENVAKEIVKWYKKGGKTPVAIILDV